MLINYSPILLFLVQSVAAAPTVELVVDADGSGPKIDLRRYALGQGGLSEKPMFDSHLEQVAQLHPYTVRIFVQEYFDLYPGHGKFHWPTLDKVLETVQATGAKPILCLCFKPPVLFPKVDQRVVHPTDYHEWEELLFRLVKHCNIERHFGVEYWEIANEPDIGEDGGCPYLFQAADYLLYYSHSAQAIHRAAPAARIGGPALAGYNSELGTKLIEHCGKGAAPLDFFSWHIYHNDPSYFRKSIHEIKARLAAFPALANTETIIDEWNMSLDHPKLEPSFQPAFILETTAGFLEEGLSRSAYYHIRDWFVDPGQFSRFMSPAGTAFMARWWNGRPQYDGLYDNQGRVRPSYFAFKALSFMQGERLNITGTNSNVHAIAVKADPDIEVLIWNFPPEGKPAEPNEVVLAFTGKLNFRFRIARLNSDSHFNEMEVQQSGRLGENAATSIDFVLESYGIRQVTFSK